MAQTSSHKGDYMNFMVDIETLDIRASSVVMSIGACLFDKELIHSSFYAELQLDPQPMRTISHGTLSFWAGQAGFKKLLDNPGKLHPFFALSNFGNYLKQQPEAKIWANSPSFDLTILNSLADDFDYVIPWNFRNFRDYRTTRVILAPDAKMEPPPHHAQDDAELQARFLIQYCGAAL